MAYHWKPSANQRKEFAQNMQNEDFAKVYYKKQEEKIIKRRSTSMFDYNKAGGNYTPTKSQHDFCLRYSELFESSEEQTAMNIVMTGYACNEKVHHDYIHIVNEKIRAYEL